MKPCIIGLWMAVATSVATAQPLVQPADLVQVKNDPGAATPGDDHGLSAAEAARIAREENGGGRVLDVRPVNGGYRVLVEKEGDVRMLFVPGS